MKRILYNILLFTSITCASAQAFISRKVFSATYICIDNDRLGTKLARIFDADSINLFDKNRLFLYKNSRIVDTLYIDLKHFRDLKYVHLHLIDNSIIIKNGYNGGKCGKNTLKYNKRTFQYLQANSDIYNPNADHMSHMSHYSSSIIIK